MSNTMGRGEALVGGATVGESTHILTDNGAVNVEPGQRNFQKIQASDAVMARGNRVSNRISNNAMISKR